MAKWRTVEKSDSDADNIASNKSSALRKRKTEETEEKSTSKKRAKTDQKIISQNNQHFQQKVDSCGTEDSNEDARSNESNTSVTKKKKPYTITQLCKLQEIEDKLPLCVMGETEANMFPRKLKFMNHTIEVMYDSRVHLWLKADDFAKALGYKNYKSAIERYVNSSFVRTFPEVLDMSRKRYGDAFHLYSVTSKALFINEAGVLQLLLRSMISNEHVTKEENLQNPQKNIENVQQEATILANRKAKYHPKPKLSADWINYQILPSLVAFSEAAKNGITAQDERRLQSMNQYFHE